MSFASSCTTYTDANRRFTNAICETGKWDLQKRLASFASSATRGDTWSVPWDSKDCKRVVVDSETHKNGFIRLSPIIRQRLFENEAHTQTRSLEMVEQQSQVYLQPRDTCTSAAADSVDIQLSVTPKSTKKCYTHRWCIKKKKRLTDS